VANIGGWLPEAAVAEWDEGDPREQYSALDATGMMFVPYAMVAICRCSTCGQDYANRQFLKAHIAQDHPASVKPASVPESVAPERVHQPPQPREPERDIQPPVSAPRPAPARYPHQPAEHDEEGLPVTLPKLPTVRTVRGRGHGAPRSKPRQEREDDA